MKIRPSLRLYFLIGVLFLGAAIVSSFSVISINNFLEGMDVVTKSFLIDAVKKQKLEEGQSASILDVSIACRWQDLPAAVRQHFNGPPQEVNTLYKYIDQDNWFQRPHEAHMVIKVQLDNHTVRYASRSFYESHSPEKKHKDWSFGLVGTTALLGLAMLGIFWLLLLLLIRNVALPMEKLREWASQLSAENLNNRAPDFRYSELNVLASLIRSSLLSVQHTLERERAFLKYASHELRTPIAVVRSNVDLLKRLLPQPETKQQAVIQRIENAGFTMSHLTDTLLWLSREGELPAESHEFDLADLLTQLAEDLHYLLKGKIVSVNLACEAITVKCNQAACRIVFANLIRNAFQHTQKGWVTIKQQGKVVEIVNHNDEVLSDEKLDLGYGLGLDLTEKLSKRLGWPYQNHANKSGHSATVVVVETSKT